MADFKLDSDGYHRWLASLSDHELRLEFEGIRAMLDKRYGAATMIEVRQPEEQGQFAELMEEEFEVELPVFTCWICRNEFRYMPPYTYRLSIGNGDPPQWGSVDVCDACMAKGADSVTAHLRHRSELEREEGAVYSAVALAVARQVSKRTLWWQVSPPSEEHRHYA